jgi:hypothetical protein
MALPVLQRAGTAAAQLSSACPLAMQRGHLHCWHYSDSLMAPKVQAGVV